MATINGETLNSLIRHYRDDQDDLDMIIKTLEAFEDYNRAIYHLEITRRLSSCDAKDRIPIAQRQSNATGPAQSITTR